MDNETKKKAIIIGAVAVIILIIVIIAVGGKNKNKPVEGNSIAQETKVVEGEKLAESKNYKGLEISNVKFEIKNSMTKITADVCNATSKKIDDQWLNVNVLDESGKRITSIGGHVKSLEPGEKTIIDSSILSSLDDVKAYDIELTEQREIVKTEENNQENNVNSQEGANNQA